MLVDTQENKQEIILEEKKEYKEPAGFWVRFGASFLDGLIISVPITILISLILTGSFFPGTQNTEIYTTQDTISQVLISIYGIVLPIIWAGFTVGKKLMNVQIRRIDGKEITFWTMFKRNIVASLIYVITIGIAGIVSIFMIALREDKRGLHDFVAGTEVVKVK
jgi:uncharacterized RDD family membrane protein YckC